MQKQASKQAHHLSFLWTPLDKQRIDQLCKKMELPRQSIVRLAIRALAWKEGIK